MNEKCYEKKTITDHTFISQSFNWKLIEQVVPERTNRTTTIESFTNYPQSIHKQLNNAINESFVNDFHWQSINHSISWKGSRGTLCRTPWKSQNCNFTRKSRAEWKNVRITNDPFCRKYETFCNFSRRNREKYHLADLTRGPL